VATPERDVVVEPGCNGLEGAHMSLLILIVSQASAKSCRGRVC
jgi:hypothetical protein